MAGGTSKRCPDDDECIDGLLSRLNFFCEDSGEGAVQSAIWLTVAQRVQQHS